MSFKKIHVKCRNARYPDKLKNIERFYVPDDKVKWNVAWGAYCPPEYTSEYIKGQEWSDLDLQDYHFNPLWNCRDGGINRISYNGEYETHDGYPLNPLGRTGLKGRGLLGRWGPNHAVDSIVTRWNKTDNNWIRKSTETNRPILQFISIQRQNGGDWALPGGMVDVEETVDQALIREFLEETLNVNAKNEDEKLNLQQQVQNCFKNGVAVYEGYVDDPRNTDNAWMETRAVHIHDEDNVWTEQLPFEPGDDAAAVRWMNIDRSLKLYASHLTFIKKVVDRMNAHW